MMDLPWPIYWHLYRINYAHRNTTRKDPERGTCIHMHGFKGVRLPMHTSTWLLAMMLSCHKCLRWGNLKGNSRDSYGEWDIGWVVSSGISLCVGKRKTFEASHKLRHMQILVPIWHQDKRKLVALFGICPTCMHFLKIRKIFLHTHTISFRYTWN